jgi:pilus assembly protein CpaB
MRWPIIALLLFGVVAAVCAAILVGTLRSGTSPEKNLSEETNVILATRSLPAMSVVISQYVKKDTVPREKLPTGYLTSPAQAIGRVLAVSVVEGQVLTQSCFVTEGTGPQLAAALPYGMRAVSLVIPSNSFAEGLLYPGCVVDILASFKLASTRGQAKGEAISTTLLRGIEVLAVEDVTVVSKQTKEGEGSAGVGGRGRSDRIRVTIMVDSKQAEALQLATTQGSISLAVRNPLDKKTVAIGTTVLNQDQLAKLGSLLRPTVFTTEEGMVEPVSEEQAGGEVDLLKAGAEGEKAATEISEQWQVTVIRGSEVKDEVVELPEGGAAAGANEGK